MNKNTIHRGKKWTITLSIIACITLIAGIFFFHFFLRRPHAMLIETVPTDVNFILQINDNESIVKSTRTITPYINELLYLDVLPGLQFFLEQFPGMENNYIISGHCLNEKSNVLMSCKLDARYFKLLLKKLQIDPRNNIHFQDQKIYTYGTHYKKFYFVYHNNTFTISENIDLVKRAIVQLKHPKNLLSDKDFKKIYDLVKKNEKQNWLIFNCHNYLSYFKNNIKPEWHYKLSQLENVSTWAAFQVRFTDLECVLSGYTLTNNSNILRYEQQKLGTDEIGSILPYSINYYSTMQTTDVNKFVQSLAGESVLQKSCGLFQQLSPRCSYSFSITKDSLTYNYVAFRCDSTLLSRSGVLQNDTIGEPLEYKNHTIYSIELGDFRPMLQSTNPVIKLNNYLINKDIYVFSDSIAPLKEFINALQNNILENNPYYRFTQNNLPSNYVYAFYISNTEESEWRRYMTDETLKKGVISKLKIFSLSHSVPQDRIVATNIFIKF